jgi:hypothetical protein
VSGKLHGQCWAVVRPKLNWYGDTVTGVVVDRVTQRRPRRPPAGSILVRLFITVPDTAFIPPVTEQHVEVAEGQFEPVTVEAGD